MTLPSLQFHLKLHCSPKFHLQISSLQILSLRQLGLEKVCIQVGYPLAWIRLLARRAIATLLILCRPHLYFHHAPNLILIVYLSSIIALILKAANHPRLSFQILAATPQPLIHEPETATHTRFHDPIRLQFYLLPQIIRISLANLMRFLFLLREV